MKTTIAAIEKNIADRNSKTSEAGVNNRLFWAYKYSLEAGNDLINFYDVIWTEDIEEIVKNLNDNGITEFTISTDFSGLIKTLAEFDKFGFTMSGITEVKQNYLDFMTGERGVEKAILMVRK